MGSLVVAEETAVGARFVGMSEAEYEAYVDEKLAEAEERMKSPDAKWYTHEEFWALVEKNVFG